MHSREKCLCVKQYLTTTQNKEGPGVRYSICVVSHVGEVKFNQVTLIPRKEFQNKSCNLLYTFGAHLETYMPS